MKMRKWILLGGMMAVMSAAVAGCVAQEKTRTASPAAIEDTAIDDGNASANSDADAGLEADVLKDAFKNDFTVGAAINMAALNDEKEMEFVAEHFNSITMGNEMKPESLLDGEATEKSKDGMPQIRTEQLDRILKVAQEKGLKMRGHCLVWYSQTPKWFFSKDYEPSHGLVDRETMKKRMEAYIKKVLTYCQEHYPGVVYAWDVVNEAVGDDVGYRTDSDWYQTYGDESYITDAFTFARKYADPDVKLFYNDYNEYEWMKRDTILELLQGLREKGLVDGMGMQSHWDIDYPGVGDLEESLAEYGKIDGLEIHFTEIDMHNTDPSGEGLEKQAERYRKFFETILRAKRTGTANITNVTFWGITDDDSWLSGFRGETSYPLLFDSDHEEKPCYRSILETAAEEYE